MTEVRGKRIFLSGPMSGKAHNNAPAFVDAHMTLVDLGAEYVHDPALGWLNTPATVAADFGHEEWMRRNIHELTDDIAPYDLVAQLPGWDQSEGARQEALVAEMCGIPCISLAEVTS